MPLTVTVPWCEDEPYKHRIEIGDDGAVRLLDHSEKTLTAFAAFQADKPACLILAERLREPEPAELIDALDHSEEYNVMARTALAWAQHVEPLVIEYTHFSFPSHMLRVAEKAFEDGEWPIDEHDIKDRFEDVRADLRVLLSEKRFSPHLVAAQDAIHTIEAAVKMARDSVTGYPSEKTFNSRLKAMGRSAYHAKGEDAVARGGDYRDEDDAKHAEVAWQRLALIKAARGLELEAMPF